jgi:acyl phosphate:glycerol-3-phosphate acyltransferase
MRTLIVIAVTSYLIGSIPFGYLLVRTFRGADIRQSGSGNIGATNVARTSPLLGVMTLALDAAKGLAAVLLPLLLSRGEVTTWIASNMSSYSEHSWLAMPSSIYTRCVLAAFVAVLGHMFPVWLRFRGGKGVATGLGAFVMLAPRAVLLMLFLFMLVIAVARYVSLASIVAVAFFPVLAWLLHDYHGTPFALAIMAMTSILIIAKHHENIGRLLAGTENRLGAKRA